MSPPTTTTTDRPNLRANGEAQQPSPRALMREAANVVIELSLPLSPARIRLLIDLYLAGGHRTSRTFREWFLSYADPTGETAVRNVLRSNR